MGAAPFPTVSLLNNPNNVNLLPDLNSLYPSGPTGPLPAPVSSGSYFNPENVTSSIDFPSTPSNTDYSSGLPDPLLNLSGNLAAINESILGPSVGAQLPSGTVLPGQTVQQSSPSLFDKIFGTNNSSSNPCPWYDLVCQFTPAGSTPTPTTSGNILGNIGNSISSGFTSAFGSTFAGFSWGRIGAFLLALILIAAGLYLFGSQQAASTVTRIVKRGTSI